MMTARSSVLITGPWPLTTDEPCPVCGGNIWHNPHLLVYHCHACKSSLGPFVPTGWQHDLASDNWWTVDGEKRRPSFSPYAADSHAEWDRENDEHVKDCNTRARSGGPI